ncbi:MAG TPA: glutamine amidotransferase [Granulicella sp.]
MFEFLFRYPIPVFTKGRLVLLSAWPVWLLIVLIVAAIVGLGLLLLARLPKAAPEMRSWRAGVVWVLRSLLVALVLFLLWEPAMTVAELKSQQNIIAVLVDDSRSMSQPDGGSGSSTTRIAAALSALDGGLLTGLQRRFQTRLYRLDTKLTRAQKTSEIQSAAPATHLNEGLRQIVTETADLPVGAIVLLSDGAENTGGIDADTVAALRNRHLPVHTIGFGRPHPAHDLEIDDIGLATQALSNSRMKATVSLHQYGYAAGKARLSVRDGDKLLTSTEITLPADGVIDTHTLFFSAGEASVKTIRFTLDPLPNEENTANNAVARLVAVNGDKRRILYVEGEPRWEYKFIRRAAEDDKSLQIVSMLRTTENKIYRQGISDPSELAAGFPSKAEDIFKYDAIILGSVEAGYFTPAQQELIREFVDKRGGGLLFLGGRFSLAEGGWSASGASDLLPTFLPNTKDTFHRDPATASLTPAGVESAITRLIDDPQQNAERWKKLPYLMDYQDPGRPKPGATVLAEMHPGSSTLPLLITQNYGRGRTALMATSGSWRWQMGSPLGDTSHDLFWQQLLRWIAADSPGRITATMPTERLMDEGGVHLTATVRDKEYTPAPGAHVQAHITGPGDISALVEMTPVPGALGDFTADWTAERPGVYGAEITDGDSRNLLSFEREDGVAENFHAGQNRDLLEKLSAQTGGRYWQLSEVNRLPSEISYSEAGISVRDTKELWDMPIIFLVLLALIAAEWLLRRKWGVL